jgi:hypothetical protein
MSTEHPTEINVTGLVIFDLNDLPPVSVTDDKITSGDTAISASNHGLSYEDLRNTAREYYALALHVRDAEQSPELACMITVIRENSDHTHDEARQIALDMIAAGATLDA